MLATTHSLHRQRPNRLSWSNISSASLPCHASVADRSEPFRRRSNTAMLFAALAIAGFGVLPIHASEKSVWGTDTSWLKSCGPQLDSHKKCAPNTITGVPIYWHCNGEERIWEPTDESCKFGYGEDEEAPTTDGDWHIGCDDADHCGYYKDHPNKRSIKSNSDTATGSTRAGSSPQKSPDWVNIPDRKGIHTRCSLSSFDLVERFNGKRWVHHYKCPPGTSCSDILGSGACRAGEYEFTIPGRSYLWVFHCPDAYKDPNTCRFSDSVHGLDFSKPLEPYLNGTTRCSPNGRAVQYLDGKKWKDIYACTADAACIEHRGRGGCEPVKSLVYPLMSRSLRDKSQLPTVGAIQWPALQRDEEGQLPTRCNPETRRQVQYFSEYYHEWADFHTCEYAGGCRNWRGKAYCYDKNQTVVPSVELANGVNGGPPQPVVQVEQAEDSELPQIRQNVVLAQGSVQTRCEPLEETQRFVQYLHPSAQQWLRFYQCSGPCFQFPEYAACEEYRDKYVIPIPPTQSFPKRAARQNLDALPYSCFDDDGDEACRLQGNTHDLPSANYSSDKQRKAVLPILFRTSCTKSNASEVLQFTDGSWKAREVCLPPYECNDFSVGKVDMALCAHPNPNTRSGKVWLPWPALSRSTNQGRVTRCKDQKTLEQFKDNVWVPYRRCRGIFQCENVEGGLNGGCAAPGLYDVLLKSGLDTSVADADRNSRPRLPKRDMGDDSLLRNSERLTEQGKVRDYGLHPTGLAACIYSLTLIQILIDEGEYLTAQSDLVLEAFFGPRDSATSFEGFAAMEDIAGDSSTEIPPDTKKPTDTSAPDPLLIPTMTSRANRCRDTSGLIDDSIDMRKQGALLIKEGSKLMTQDRNLLEIIFGAQTEEYIKNITGRGMDVVTGYSISVDLPAVPNLQDVDDIYDVEVRHKDTDSDTE
ncbi:hypothetical protein SLS60_006933 [Paraconiothyrium brasiliense]|uniref:Uncharacterized protein n=1 Tax=Paraconiothyrium brasiliense TaxID=300254 RepID=A0ABR3R875_9PLEO